MGVNASLGTVTTFVESAAALWASSDQAVEAVERVAEVWRRTAAAQSVQRDEAAVVAGMTSDH